MKIFNWKKKYDLACSFCPLSVGWIGGVGKEQSSNKEGRKEEIGRKEEKKGKCCIFGGSQQLRTLFCAGGPRYVRSMEGVGARRSTLAIKNNDVQDENSAHRARFSAVVRSAKLKIQFVTEDREGSVKVFIQRHPRLRSFLRSATQSSRAARLARIFAFGPNANRCLALYHCSCRYFFSANVCFGGRGCSTPLLDCSDGSGWQTHVLVVVLALVRRLVRW